MEPVTKAQGELAALHPEDATATAPIPITRWTSGDDQPFSSSDDQLLSSSEVADTSIDLGRIEIGDERDSKDVASADVGMHGAGSARQSAGDPGSIDGTGSDDPTHSHAGSFMYSGRLDTAITTWWPAPVAEDEPATSDSTTESDESTSGKLTAADEAVEDEFDSAPATTTNEVIDFGRRLRAVPDHRSDVDGDQQRRPSPTSDAPSPARREGLFASVDLDVNDGAAPYGEPVFCGDPPAEVFQSFVEEPTTVQDTGGGETVPPVPDHEEPKPDGAGAPHRVGGATVDATADSKVHELDTAGGHLEAASYADTPRTPMVDLRDGSGLEPEGVTNAIRAGEHQVIETLIRQGMLSTSGPITDRDVRTMVYVAFTSNELRKLILSGGRLDTERADLELGPVELFDERRFAPTPRTVYTRPDPSPELFPARADVAGDISDVECEPALEGEPVGTTMPAPRHIYRLGSDSSPETVA